MAVLTQFTAVQWGTRRTALVLVNHHVRHCRMASEAEAATAQTRLTELIDALAAVLHHTSEPLREEVSP